MNILGSDTDISTSNENLSMEQRYVLRHTPRVEPQGQENLLESNQSGNEHSGWISHKFTHVYTSCYRSHTNANIHPSFWLFF